MRVFSIGTDLRGSAMVACDADGRPAAWFGYGPFGCALTHHTGGASPLVARLMRRYTGAVFEEESGLYDYGARRYDAALARFVAADPARQGASPYVYCGNDPVDARDPDGRSGRFVIEYFGAWHLFKDDGTYLGEISIHDAEQGQGMLRTTPMYISDKVVRWNVVDLVPAAIRASFHSALNDADKRRVLTDYLRSRSMPARGLKAEHAEAVAVFFESLADESISFEDVAWPLRGDSLVDRRHDLFGGRRIEDILIETRQRGMLDSMAFDIEKALRLRNRSPRKWAYAQPIAAQAFREAFEREQQAAQVAREFTLLGLPAPQDSRDLSSVVKRTKRLFATQDDIDRAAPSDKSATTSSDDDDSAHGSVRSAHRMDIDLPHEVVADDYDRWIDWIFDEHPHAQPPL